MSCWALEDSRYQLKEKKKRENTITTVFHPEPGRSALEGLWDIEKQADINNYKVRFLVTVKLRASLKGLSMHKGDIKIIDLSSNHVVKSYYLMS